MPPRQKVLITSVIIMAGFVVAVFFYYVRHYYIHPHPLTVLDISFLYQPAKCFDDLRSTLQNAKNLDPYARTETGGSYFPLTYLLLYPLAQLSKWPNLFLFIASLTGFMAYFNIKFISPLFNKSCNHTLLKTAVIFILTALTYPFLFCLDRGNIEAYLFIIMGSAILAYQKERYSLAAVLFSVVTAVKLFPGVFFILILCRKQYKALFQGLACGLLFTLASLLVFKGSVESNVQGLSYWLKQFNYLYVEGNGGIPYGHSLFGVLKLMTAFIYPQAFTLDYHTLFYRQGYQSWYEGLKQAYTIFWLLSLGVGCCWVWFREKVLWKQLFILTVLTTSLPYVSLDYKLMYFQIPMLFFFTEKQRRPADMVYAVLFGLLLIPKSWWCLQYAISSSVILNPLIMLVMLGLFLTESWWTKDLQSNLQPTALAHRPLE